MHWCCDAVPSTRPPRRPDKSSWQVAGRGSLCDNRHTVADGSALSACEVIAHWSHSPAGVGREPEGPSASRHTSRGSWSPASSPQRAPCAQSHGAQWVHPNSLLYVFQCNEQVTKSGAPANCVGGMVSETCRKSIQDRIAKKGGGRVRIHWSISFEYAPLSLATCSANMASSSRVCGTSTVPA